MAGNTFSWNGGTCSATTPTNWTPNGVPAAGDTAIALSGDMVLSADVQLNSDRLEGGNAALTFAGDLSTNLESSTTHPSTLTLNIATCLAAGTRIAADCGEVAVEELAVGDRVQVVGAARAAQPIISLGQRTVNCAWDPEPRKVWPVRIRTGAFGPRRPCRDLWLSPDHAVFIGDVLIPVKHLINGNTIAQVPVDEVTYYYVELPRHAVILAEGLPAESYLDTGDRRNVANRAGPYALYTDFWSRIWDAEGCAPLVVTGPQLDAARHWVNGLAGRAILAA